MRGPLSSIVLAALTACTHTPTPPATQIKVVRETVEVFKGCNIVAPPRPGPLGDIPQNSEQALAKVGAKLTEYAGPGKWADRMEKALAICLEE